MKGNRFQKEKGEGKSCRFGNDRQEELFEGVSSRSH